MKLQLTFTVLFAKKITLHPETKLSYVIHAQLVSLQSVSFTTTSRGYNISDAFSLASNTAL